jgi:hypothetical protein
MLAQSQPYAGLSFKVGVFLTTFLHLKSRASYTKAKGELGWMINVEKVTLDEIIGGSYVLLTRGCIRYR